MKQLVCAKVAGIAHRYSREVIYVIGATISHFDAGGPSTTI